MCRCILGYAEGRLHIFVFFAAFTRPGEFLFGQP